VLPWRYDVEMGTVNSLHASAYYGEYNERFGNQTFHYIGLFILFYRSPMYETFRTESKIK